MPITDGYDGAVFEQYSDDELNDMERAYMEAEAARHPRGGPTMSKTRKTPPDYRTAAGTAALRALVERRQRVKHWGQDCWITPRLVAVVLGDGGQLIGLAPTMYRPNHFLVRIGSTWSLHWQHHHDSKGEPTPEEWLDDVYEAIEGEFDVWPWADDYWRVGDKEAYEGEAEEHRRVSFNDGACWWKEKWPGER